jgi:dinuclear metal center YbgI/SA1388 family protein
VADRDAMIAYLDDLLEVDGFEDYGPNGLQVPGAAEVELVATGVSAHLELFEAAAEAGAQLVLCHHGLFWSGDPAVVTPQLKARLTALFNSDMSLAAYHLPLDAHPEVGNNALLCDALGLRRAEPFGAVRGRPIGFVGRSEDGITADELVDRCRAVTEREPLLLGEGPDLVLSAAVVTGGGASTLPEATRLGVDALVTGEPSERSMAEAREAGTHFVAAGHYATETFGVRRLGELLADRFDVEHRFIAIPNPV